MDHYRESQTRVHGSLDEITPMEASDYEIKPGKLYRSTAVFDLYMYPGIESFDLEQAISDPVKYNNYILVLEVKMDLENDSRNFCKVLLLRAKRVGWLALEWMDYFDEVGAESA